MIVHLTLDLQLLDGEEQSFALVEGVLREELEGMFVGTDTDQTSPPATDYLIHVLTITEGEPTYALATRQGPARLHSNDTDGSQLQPGDE